ncbi:MAG: hypothetical protein JST40_08180 [Armatimonadetes bacterium]|nr:hypothetical protein [Armatimonadota bacterium]
MFLWATAFSNVLWMSLSAFLATTVALILFATFERKAAPQPINAISHIVFGESVLGLKNLSFKHTGIGLILNFAALFGWAILMEIILATTKVSTSDLMGNSIVALVVTVVAFIVDFHVVPKRLTPGFENVISRGALLLVYLVLMLSLAGAAMMRSPVIS